MPADPPLLLLASEFPSNRTSDLRTSFTVLDRLHLSNPSAFEVQRHHIRGIVIGARAPLPVALLKQLPRLEIIAVGGAGYDNVDLQAALARNLRVLHAPEGHAQDVADFAWASVMSLGRDLMAAHRFVCEGQWLHGSMPLGQSLRGRSVGIFGLGAVGRQVAALAQAFGMPVAYSATACKPEVPWTFIPDPIALANQVDFLILTASGGPSTQKVVNAAVLNALGPTGYLINVARGSLIDTPALLHALRQGHIAGAALDVFEQEPDVSDELKTLPHVLLSPHMASATHQARGHLWSTLVSGLVDHFDGRTPNCLIPECKAVASLHHLAS